MDKPITLKIMQSHYHTYLDVLARLRADSGWFFSKKKNEVNTVPFILTAAAGLECMLNDNILKHYKNTYDAEQAGSLIPGILSMTLRGKLLNVVPLLTQNKYCINTNHKIYQSLADLISIRNQLVHNKSAYETFDALVKEDEKGGWFIEPGEDAKKRMDSDSRDFTFGIDRDIGIYHDSLESLYDMFFYIYDEDDFEGNDLIVELKDNNEIVASVEENA